MTDSERRRVFNEAVAELKRVATEPGELDWLDDSSEEGDEADSGNGDARGTGGATDQDLWACGEAVVALLHLALEALLRHPNVGTPQDLRKARQHFRSLFVLADDKINAVPFSEVQACWLRLYTDVSIGLALCDLADELAGPVNGGRALRRAVRCLDMAIIVAGAPGKHRSRMIQDLIRVLQAGGHSAPAEPPSERPSKRRKSAPSATAPRLTAPQGIPEPAKPPSIPTFLDSAHRRPFILRGHAADWPACRRWANAADLLSRVGDGRVVPVEVGQSYTDENWGQQIIDFGDFLQYVGFADVPHDPVEAEDPLASRPLYLAQHSLFKQFPDLVGDMIMPDYVYAEPPAPEHMPEYVKPGSADGLVTNVWIGPGEGKVTSPAHTDPYYNCYVQVLGRKRVWLAPPAATPHMYAFDPAAAAPDDAESSPTTSYTTNTSRVPIFDGKSEDSTRRFPAFHRNVIPQSLETVLEPGDMLFMPPKWWHAMRSEGEGVSWSVSMWF